MKTVHIDLNKIPPAERRILNHEARRRGISTIELVKRAALEHARKIVGNPDTR